MTDLYRLLDFLGQAKVPFVRSKGPVNITINIGSWLTHQKPEDSDLPLISGYSGFEHVFTFNVDEKLIESGTWE